jgi:signal peptidase II
LNDSTETTPTPRRWSWIPLIVAAGVVIADQITKAVALADLSAKPHHVLGPVGLQLTFNTGSAFSLFTGSSGLLMVVDLVLIAVLVTLGGRASLTSVRVGLGLILGGAIGNFCDRVFRHHDRGVIDFVTLSHWPTFNLADSAITIGAVVVVVGLLVQTHESSDSNGTT